MTAPNENTDNQLTELIIPGTAVTPQPATTPLQEVEIKPPAEDAVTEPQIPALDPESPFAPFNDLRGEMMKAGVDFSQMDAKVSAGESLTEVEIATIAKYSKRSEADVSAYLSLVNRLGQVQQKALAHDTQKAEVYEAELNEICGGSWKELIEDAAKHETPDQIKIYNILLNAKNADGTQDTELQKTTLKQMQASRLARTPQPNKPANLSLLTKANATVAATPKPSPKPEETNQPAPKPLEGNPLAHASLGVLCSLKMDANHRDHKAALAVLAQKYPELA